MANNYTESSSKLQLTLEQSKQAQAIIDAARAAYMALDPDESEPTGCFDLEDDCVWMYHDESIDVEFVAFLAQALLEAFEIDEPFVFSWSYTCSKPRLDEFGGGACAVRRGKDPVWVDARSHVEALVNSPQPL